MPDNNVHNIYVFMEKNVKNIIFIHSDFSQFNYKFGLNFHDHDNILCNEYPLASQLVKLG